MKRLKISDQAWTDFADIAEYIATESGSRITADRFIDQLLDKCETLSVLGGTLGRSRDELEPGLRSVAYKAYVILFRYEGDTVHIVTVLSGLRDIDAMFSDAPSSDD